MNSPRDCAKRIASIALVAFTPPLSRGMLSSRYRREHGSFEEMSSSPRLTHSRKVGEAGPPREVRGQSLCFLPPKGALDTRFQITSLGLHLLLCKMQSLTMFLKISH